MELKSIVRDRFKYETYRIRFRKNILLSGKSRLTTNFNIVCKTNYFHFILLRRVIAVELMELLCFDVDEMTRIWKQRSKLENMYYSNGLTAIINRRGRR